MEPLNAQRQKFVHAYLKTGLARQAAIQAGYAEKGARTTAYRLLRQPAVKAAIKAGQEKAERAAEVTAADVRKELAVIAFSTVKDFVANAEGELTLAPGVPESAWRAVSRIKYTTRLIPRKDQAPLIERTAELSLWNKNEALVTLGRCLSMFVDRHEITLTQVHLLAILGMSDLELSAFLQAMNKKEHEVALKLLPGGKGD